MILSYVRFTHPFIERAGQVFVLMVRGRYKNLALATK
jgi:hypothetical protein